MIPQYMAPLVESSRLPPQPPAAPKVQPAKLAYRFASTSCPDNLTPDVFNQFLSFAGPSPTTINATIQELFEQQVAAQPYAQAVESWDGSFSYADLDALSRNLALQLIIRHRVGAEDLIPFCANKSKWVPVAVLGILRAGAACAAFDPTLPRARLAELTEQIGAKVIVTGADCEHIAHCLAKRPVVVDERLSVYLPPPQTLYPSKLLKNRSVPHNAAVVQFSSGSTGTPKSILIEHVALASSFEAFGSRWGIDPNTRVFQYAAHSFDVAIGDLLAPLTRGGCVCIPSEQERLNDLAGCMRRMHVNWTFFTPTLAKTLKPSDVPSLRTLVMGGEAILRQNLTTWADEVNLILAYGMAEASIYSSSTAPTNSTSDPSNIGTAFGSRVWVCNESNKPVAPGTVGEMLIEGPGLARGYLNDPDRTAAAFVPTPSWLLPYAASQSLLKTGDYARYLPNGTLQFAGRRDDHLKTRGFEAEIGEIEHHVKAGLAEHAEDAVVDLIDTGDKYGLKPARLVAVYVPASGRSSSKAQTVSLLPLSTTDARHVHDAVAYLQEVLPSSTVPNHFIPIDRLPLTTSGKCNRKALRELLEACDEQVLAEYTVGGRLVEADVSNIPTAVVEGRRGSVMIAAAAA